MKEAKYDASPGEGLSALPDDDWEFEELLKKWR